MSSWLMNPFRFAAPVVSPDEYTMLLAHFDGANGSTDFVDSAGRHTLTAHGNAQISTAQAKFGQSLKCNATGDFVRAPASSDFDFGSGDFTLEWFMRYTATNQFAILDLASGQAENLVLLYNGGYDYWVYWNGGGEYYIRGNTPEMRDGAFHHHAVVRHASVMYYYLDGVLLGSNSSLASSAKGNATSNFEFGNIYSPSPAEFYIDELRISKGIARWTSNFTPPTAPYDQPDPDVMLLLPMIGANDSTVFTDIATGGNAPHTIAANGGAKIITTQADPFSVNGGVGYLDGVDDYLSLPGSPDFSSGSGDFTIETWVKLETSTTHYPPLFCLRTDSNNILAFFIRNSNAPTYQSKLELQVKKAGTWIIEAYGHMTIDTNWHHTAVSRSGNTYRLFVDGVIVQTHTNSAELPNFATTQPWIGRSAFTDDNTFYYRKGFSSDFAFTRRAKYTTNFTPPGRLLP
jgi:hypothetical protein